MVIQKIFWMKRKVKANLNKRSSKKPEISKPEALESTKYTILKVLFIKELSLHIFEFIYNDIPTLFQSRLVSMQWKRTFSQLNWFKIVSINYPNHEHVKHNISMIQKGQIPVLRNWFEIFMETYQNIKSNELNKLYNTTFLGLKNGNHYAIFKRNALKVKSMVTFPEYTSLWRNSNYEELYQIQGNKLNIIVDEDFSDKSLMDLIKELSKLYEHEYNHVKINK